MLPHPMMPAVLAVDEGGDGAPGPEGAPGRPLACGQAPPQVPACCQGPFLPPGVWSRVHQLACHRRPADEAPHVSHDTMTVLQ